jgi:hypothetical protein
MAMAPEKVMWPRRASDVVPEPGRTRGGRAAREGPAAKWIF